MPRGFMVTRAFTSVCARSASKEDAAVWLVDEIKHTESRDQVCRASRQCWCVWIAVCALSAAGCSGSRQQVLSQAATSNANNLVAQSTTASHVFPASHQQASPPVSRPRIEPAPPEELVPPPVASQDSLEELESWAISGNPTLRRMQEEAAAERSKAGYVGKLPDPTVGTMFFGNAMNFVPDTRHAPTQLGRPSGASLILALK